MESDVYKFWKTPPSGACLLKKSRIFPISSQIIQNISLSTGLSNQQPPVDNREKVQWETINSTLLKTFPKAFRKNGLWKSFWKYPNQKWRKTGKIPLFSGDFPAFPNNPVENLRFPMIFPLIFHTFSTAC